METYIAVVVLTAIVAGGVVKFWKKIITELAGKRIAVIGANGAGKTTLFRFFEMLSMQNTEIQATMTITPTGMGEMRLELGKKSVFFRCKQTKDMPGSEEYRNTEWQKLVQDSDPVLYLVHASRLLRGEDEEIIREMKNFQKNLKNLLDATSFFRGKDGKIISEMKYLEKLLKDEDKKNYEAIVEEINDIQKTFKKEKTAQNNIDDFIKNAQNNIKMIEKKRIKIKDETGKRVKQDLESIEKWVGNEPMRVIIIGNHFDEIDEGFNNHKSNYQKEFENNEVIKEAGRGMKKTIGSFKSEEGVKQVIKDVYNIIKSRTN